MFPFLRTVRSGAKGRFLDCEPVQPSSGYNGPSLSELHGQAKQPAQPAPAPTALVSGKDKKLYALFETFKKKILRLEGVDTSKIEKGELQCKICFKQLKTTTLLRRHVRKVHEGRGKFTCQQQGCDKTFMSRSTMEAHEAKVHLGEGVKCETCNKTFTSKRNLNTHKKLHGPKLTFVCPKCKKTYSQKRYLDEHVPTCKENPDRNVFSCIFCNKEFHARKHLNEHVREEH